MNEKADYINSFRPEIPPDSEEQKAILTWETGTQTVACQMDTVNFC